MDFQQFCRACLISDVKMYNLNKPSLMEAYLQIIQTTSFEDQEQWVCYECAYMLQKCYKFYLKCYKAHELLLSFGEDNGLVTIDKLKQINRQQYNLDSNLIQTSIARVATSDVIDTKYYIEETITSTLANNNKNIKQETVESSIEIVSELNEVNVNEVSHNSYLHEDSINVSDSSLDDENYSESVLKEIKTQIEIVKRKKKENTKTDAIYLDVESDYDNEPLAKIAKTTGNSSTKKSEFNEKELEEYATVVLMTPKDAKKEVLIRKESSNYKYCEFKCELCYRAYDVKTAFENHMKKHKVESGPFECKFCFLRFTKKSNLTSHWQITHKRKFCCKLCSYICFSSNQARSHMGYHKGTKYSCSECGEHFSMPNTLSMHKRLKHKFDSEFICALCGKTFAKKQGLQAHKVFVHRQEKNEMLGPKCEECVIHFASEEAWKRHLVASSKHSTSNGCQYCGETFPDEASLRKHTKEHTRRIWKNKDPKLPGPCEICRELITDRKEYKSHMTNKHPDTKEAKKIDEDEKKQHVCEFCGKAFVKSVFLIYHRRKHTGERPHKCDECDKTFGYPSALYSHKASHKIKTKDEKCEMCDKMFKTRSALSKHVKNCGRDLSDFTFT